MSAEHCKCLERHSDCFNNGTCYICNACGKVYFKGAPDRPNRLAARLINEAILWPIHYRIAARLHLSGIHSDEIEVKHSDIPQPMLLSVVNALRELENGSIDHDAKKPGVRSLAALSESEEV
jgi:hypothetical protein